MLDKRGIFLALVVLVTIHSVACGMSGGVETDISSEATPARNETSASALQASPMPETVSSLDDSAISEIFGTWLTDDMKNYYQKYDADEYADIKPDDLSRWKDGDGGYICPDDYRIRWVPNDDTVMAAQQFPQALLDEISTDELYQLILSLPGTWQWGAFDNYLYGLASYYSRYNFIADFMSREDASEIVHQHYLTYSKKEKNNYSKCYMGELDDSELRKREHFQLVESMEWFFLYRDGEEIPDKTVFGL